MAYIFYISNNNMLNVSMIDQLLDKKETLLQIQLEQGVDKINIQILAAN